MLLIIIYLWYKGFIIILNFYSFKYNTAYILNPANMFILYISAFTQTYKSMFSTQLI